MERENKVRRLNDDEGPSENGNDEKVDDGGGGNETNDNELSDMDKLPPEILMKILRYLSEQELVKSRIVSSRWNEICCLLLQVKVKNNPNSKLVLELEKSRGESGLDCKTVIKKSLEDFLSCFFPSEAEKSSSRRPRKRPFPFSSFKISSLFYMYGEELTKFVSAFRHIKTLFLEIKAQDVEAVGIFWRLLLKFAPNIEHVTLSSLNAFNRVILFEPYFNFNVDSDPDDEAQNQNNTFLKNLKVVEITTGRFSALESFVPKLMSNAPNLQKLTFNIPEGYGCIPHDSMPSSDDDMLNVDWSSIPLVSPSLPIEILTAVIRSPSLRYNTFINFQGKLTPVYAKKKY